MRIAWISHSADLGGAELCLVESVQSLVERGARVIAFVPRPDEVGDRLAAVGAEVRTIRYTWWMAPAHRQRPLLRLKRRLINNHAVRELARQLQQWRPDVVVSNSLTCAVGAFAARRCGRPHVWSIHELYGATGHGLFFDCGERQGLALARELSARIVVPSQAAWNVYEPAIGSDRLRLVHHAIHLPTVPTSQTLPRARFTLVQLGAIIAGKRAEDAVRAVGQLRRANVPVRLRLVGREHPAYGQFLRRLITKEGVEDAVELHGFAHNPLDQLAAADACVMCSQGECAPRVTIEAMKCGLPVVAARSGGLTEQIRHGETGLLFEPGDPIDLAQKIRLLIESPDQRRRIAQAGQTWANATHNLTRHGAQWETVLTEAIQSPDAD